MTAPYQTAPDGSFTVGGGEWNYGQQVGESLAKAAFMLPELTPGSVMDVLRVALERLPLDALKVFQPLFGLAEELFTDVGSAVTAIIDNLITKPVMQTVDAFNTWLDENFHGVLTQFQTFLGTIPSLNTWLDVLKAVVDTFGTLFSTFGTNLWTALSGVVTTFTTLFNALGTSIWTVLSELITHFVGLFTGAGSVVTWLQGVLTTLSKLPAWNLFGQIPATVMGVLNIGHLTTDPVNLILHPSFEDSTTVSPVDGWSWDGTTNATGSGGSAKVVLDGFNKELNHQTAVYVAPGDKMTISAQFKSSGITGSGWKAAVTVMEYRNGAIATPVEIVSRTTNAASFVTLAGDYYVPAGVSSVVFRLVVEGATAGTAWFDDLNMHKSGILEQGWVENLPNTWENFWGGLVGTSGTGKTWADMGTAGGAVRTAAGGAQGAADAANGSHQLNWNYLYDAHVGNPVGTSSGQNAYSAATAAAGVKATQNNANTAVFGTTAPTTTTKIQTAALPSTVAAVGSGILLTRSSDSVYPVTWQTDRSTVTHAPLGFYTSGSATTADLIREPSGGSESVRALNAGWYQVEVGYKLEEAVQYAYWWSFTPAIYESRTGLYKYGTSVVTSRDTWVGGSFSYSASSAQSSFIVYMNAGDRVIPGWNTNKEYNGTGSNNIIGPCSASNTYFSVALLNRSLA